MKSALCKIKLKMKEKVSKQPKFTNLGYILHLIGFLHFSFGTYYNIAYVHIPEELFYIEHNVKYQNMTTDFGGKFQYLTIINLVSKDPEFQVRIKFIYNPTHLAVYVKIML